MRFSFLLSLLLTVQLLSSQTRPNIIFIMADDHAAQAVGCYGSRINQTPNLDRIAQNGMLFSHAYCTNSICSPVRAVNITGKMSQINGVLDNMFPFDGSQPTAPKYLQAAGYQTAMIGKWHLKSDPTGFDFWKILIDQGEYYNPRFIENGENITTEGYATALITDYALDWLQQRDPNQPFFMMLHHKAPHRNWMPDLPYLHLYDSVSIPEPFTLFDDYKSRSDAARQQEMSLEKDMNLQYDLKLWQDTMPGQHPWMAQWMEHRFETMTPTQREAFKAAYQAENEVFMANPPTGKELVRWKYQRYIKDYLRCIASVDDNVGRVLDYLKETGLDSNTIVVYTSDQGFFLGEHGWFDKRFMYEESYRQPLLVQWPGHIPANSRNDALVVNLDFAPTFMDMAGLEVPSDMQGASLKPILLSNQTPSDWRQETYYHYFEYPGIHAVKRHYGVRTQRYKLIHFYFDIDAWELYDLDEDPEELRNVYENPGYQAVRSEMHRKLDSLQIVYQDLPEDFEGALEPATLQHIAFANPCLLKFPPEKPVTGQPLTDGLYQLYSIYNAGIRDGYVAFRKQPLEAVVKLGHWHTVRNIGVHCMQSPESWIYYPEDIRVLVSKRGKRYKEIGKMAAQPDAIPKPGHQWFRLQTRPRKIRYVKVIANSRAAIPEHQAGAGQRAWLFCDEISVE
ncbi:MAG: sulfatase-like hydrolase/transferase [Lewinellaceae bacterium]|nr:sulfatase-like hydrolase/transferase [Lewinellaceae bacterium]